MKIAFKKIKHKRYKYEVLKRYQQRLILVYIPSVYKSKYFAIDDYTLIIYPGYCADGCTGAPDIKGSIRASFIRDIFYQCFRGGWLDRKIYRKYADQLFHRILLEDGVNRFTARVYYLAVRLFGRFSAKGDPKRMNP